MIDLRLGDCVERTREIADASIDLILTSPPYDNLRRYASGSAFDFEALAAECKRVLKPGGVLVWVVGDQTINGSETGTSFRQALHFKAIGLRLRDTMIWRKLNPMPCGDQRSHYVGAFEFMFVFTQGKPESINLIRRPCKRAGQMCSGRIREHGSFLGKKWGDCNPVRDTSPRTNIWEYAVGGQDRCHPATFPLQLAIDHILSWTNPGDLVLDPFAGSGTTGEACLKTGRDFIGIELSPVYHAIAQSRLASARPQVA